MLTAGAPTSIPPPGSPCSRHASWSPSSLHSWAKACRCPRVTPTSSESLRGCHPMTSNLSRRHSPPGERLTLIAPLAARFGNPESGDVVSRGRPRPPDSIPRVPAFSGAPLAADVHRSSARADMTPCRSWPSLVKSQGRLAWTFNLRQAMQFTTGEVPTDDVTSPSIASSRSRREVRFHSPSTRFGRGSMPSSSSPGAVRRLLAARAGIWCFIINEPVSKSTRPQQAAVGTGPSCWTMYGRQQIPERNPATRRTAACRQFFSSVIPR